MRVMGFGTYDRSRHPRVGILLDGFAEHGEDVLELNRPIGFSTADRVGMLTHPSRSLLWVARNLAKWWALCVLRIRHRAYRPDAVIVGYLGQFDILLARLLYPRAIRVLDLLIFAEETAEDREVHSSTKLKILRLIDRAAMSAASVILVDTEEHLELVPQKYRSRGVVAHVGAEKDWFAQPRTRGYAEPLRVIFFGAYTPLQGAQTIGEALTKLPHGSPIRVTMVGRGQDWESTRRAAATADVDIEWLDWVDPEDLPRMVAEHHVCLGIFGTSRKALSVTPNKVFEGCAAGCAVITSDTRPQRECVGSAALYVEPGNSDELAAALVELAGDDLRLADMQRRAYLQASEHFTAARIVEPLRSALDALVSQRRVRNARP
jgi:glycosyltransferase involved in cell wall biosynthesis